MKKISIVIVIMLLMTILYAESYTLNELIESALKNSHSIQRSLKSRENILDNHRKNLYDLLPNASYSATYSERKSLDAFYSSSISLSKSIYLNEPTYFNLKRSNIDKKISDLNHQNIQKRIALDVINSYIDILQTQKNIQISKENLKLQKRIHEQVLIQFQNNRRTIYDIQQSQIDTLNSHINLIDLNNNLKKLRENLFFTVKLEDKGYPIEVIDFEVHEQNTDFNSNLNIEAAKFNLNKSNVSLTQSYLSLFPSLSLNYSWGTSANETSGGDLLKTANYNDSYTFSINLSYPLFNQLHQGTNYRMAKRSLLLEELEINETIDETKKLINQTVRDWELIHQTYSLYEQRHTLTKANLAIAEERFALGVISSLDLDKARIQYLESEMQLVNRFYTLIRKQEEINYLKSENILGKW